MNPSSTPSIRAAESRDVEDIKNCATLAYGKYVERLGKAPAPMVADFSASVQCGHVFVAILDKKLIGYVICYPTDSSMHLENVAVLPEHCGKGVGKILIHHVEQRAGLAGLDSVQLYTNIVMHENLKMYPALGYTEYDRRSEDGFDRVYFRKPLR